MMKRELGDWDGEFDKLIGWKDELLGNPEICEELFASKHEALAAGSFIGTHETATAGAQIGHPTELAEQLPNALSFDVFSNETFDQFKARVNETLDEMSAQEYDGLRHSSIPTTGGEG